MILRGTGLLLEWGSANQGVYPMDFDSKEGLGRTKSIEVLTVAIIKG